MQHGFLPVWLDAAGIHLVSHICANTYGHGPLHLRAQVCAARSYMHAAELGMGIHLGLPIKGMPVGQMR